MTKKYYCDYCKNSFKDNPNSRKKHITGQQHQTLKKEHYAKFTDIQTFIEEESERTTCPRILRNLECSFGSRCRFSHFTKDYLELVKLRDEKAKEKQSKTMTLKLNKFLMRIKATKGDGIDCDLPWTYNELQYTSKKLPLSLQIIIPNDISTDFQEWG